MIEVNHPLLTKFYTKMIHEDNPKFGAPHHFIVRRVEDDRVVGKVDFQEGPVKECGVNGIGNEDVLGMILLRLEGFQQTEFACEENVKAIEHIKNALKILRERTNKRRARNVEGTSNV